MSFNGNVTIGPDAKGSLEFRNVGLLNGSISAQNNPALTSLSFKYDDPHFNLDGWVKDIVMQNLTAFTSFSFPYILTMLGSIVFDNLPSLETVNLSMLNLFQDTRLKELPELRTFLVNPVAFGSAGDIEVKNVGINSLDEILRIGFGNDNVYIDGIPNVKSLAYNLAKAQNVSIHGGGDLALSFDCTACTVMTNPERKETVLSIGISGASSVDRNDTTNGRVLEIVVDTFTAKQNTFTSLPIDFTNLSSLYVIDNVNLTTLWSNANFTKYGWKDITISGNPNLRMNSTTVLPNTLRLPSLNSTWVWPSVDVSSMTFEGPFGHSFLSVPLQLCFFYISDTN